MTPAYHVRLATLKNRHPCAGFAALWLLASVHLFHLAAMEFHIPAKSLSEVFYLEPTGLKSRLRNNTPGFRQLCG